MVTSSEDSEGNCQICHICRSFPTRRLVEVLRSRAPDIGISREPIHWASRTKSDHKIKLRFFGTFCWNILETLCSACRFWGFRQPQRHPERCWFHPFNFSISALFNETGSACPACDNSHAGPVQATKDGWPSICSKQAVEHVLPNLACHWGLKDIEGYWKILKDIESETIYLKLSETCWNSTFFSSLLMVKRPSQRLCTRKRKRRRRRNLSRLRGERWWNIAHTHFEIGRETATETGNRSKNLNAKWVRSWLHAWGVRFLLTLQLIILHAALKFSLWTQRGVSVRDGQ